MIIIIDNFNLITFHFIILNFNKKSYENLLIKLFNKNVFKFSCFET